MKKLLFWSLLIVSLVIFVVGCGGKSTSIEGKVLDAKGRPLAKVKVAAKMLQPISGYEHFETKTGSNGSYKFKKLFPTSAYELIIFSNRSTVDKTITIQTGPEGEKMMVTEHVVIRFIVNKDGTVTDTKTNLMWAAQDNGSDMEWSDANYYCKNYRVGGYKDWRLPTTDELIELSLSEAKKYMDIKTGYSENQAASFVSSMARGTISSDSDDRHGGRVLPVRSGK